MGADDDVLVGQACRRDHADEVDPAVDEREPVAVGARDRLAELGQLALQIVLGQPAALGAVVAAPKLV